ncbi:hypothetical protein V1522DRAFT_433036 [Lipomyces starkeyi]
MTFRSQSLGEGIVYLPDFSTLFCTKHNSAIPSRELKNHLRLNTEHKLPPAVRQPILNAAQAINPQPKATLGELAALPHGSEPLPFLPILNGMRCRACPTYEHVEKEHPIKRGQEWQDDVEEVTVQRWVDDTRGTYWIVGGVARCEKQMAPKSAYERVLEAMEAEEEVEVEEERKRNQQEDDAKNRDESTPWLKTHTKWPARFKGRPLNILAITKNPPSSSPKIRRTGLAAGTHHGVTVQWDGWFEERLPAIMMALRQMLERCLSTLDTTDTPAARWINSIDDSCYPNTQATNLPEYKV